MYNKSYVNQLFQQISELLIGKGFKKTLINDIEIYVYNQAYYKVTYSETLGFIIEYAQSLRDVKNNLFEDSATYPLSLGENLIMVMQQDLKNYIL